MVLTLVREAGSDSSRRSVQCHADLSTYCINAQGIFLMESVKKSTTLTLAT